jgi:hypothetical protein
MSVSRYTSLAKTVFSRDYSLLFADKRHWCKKVETTHLPVLKELYNRIDNTANVGMTRFYFDLNENSELILPKTQTKVPIDVLRYMTEKGFVYDPTTSHVPCLSWEKPLSS